MTSFTRPRLSLFALALVTGLTSVTSPALVGVASAPAPPACPKVARADASCAAVPRAGPSARFEWPLAAPHPVVRAFEEPSSPYGPGHRGVDLGGVAGAPVLSAGAGVVVFAGPLAGRGVVSVDHPNGLRTTYEPLSPAVVAGRRVAAGAVLGRLRAGHRGCPSACLHWGVRRGDEYLDPLSLVATGHVRLLPWEEES